MTRDARQLIRTSFAQLEPRAGIVSLLFYQRLFNLAPGLQSMFTGDIEAQGVKLMAMLRAVTDGLDAPGDIVPALHEMGRRHAGYGVRDSQCQYDLVGQALLETFADVPGSGFPTGAREAWAAAYDWIASFMKAGAAASLPLPPHTP
jgi:hemoglobin-like flavoprotein